MISEKQKANVLKAVEAARYARRKSFRSALAVQAQLRLYGQPKGRAFLADFRSPGRQRSSDRLTST